MEAEESVFFYLSTYSEIAYSVTERASNIANSFVIRIYLKYY